jgi:hypothetical protein
VANDGLKLRPIDLHGIYFALLVINLERIISKLAIAPFLGLAYFLNAP